MSFYAICSISISYYHILTKIQRALARRKLQQCVFEAVSEWSAAPCNWQWVGLSRGGERRTRSLLLSMQKPLMAVDSMLKDY